MRSKLRIFSYILVVCLLLSACGTKNNDNKSGEEGSKGSKGNFSVAMVTDVGGIDDKSFNSSAWQGIQNFAKANGLKKGDGGYDYLQSKSDSDYNTNLNQLIRRDFDLVFGIGFLMEDAVLEIAEQQPKAKLAIVDAEVDAPNVASILFKEHEGSFLAGVVAAKMTKSGKVGFIGGMENEVIKRFEAGFTAGVKAVDPKIKVDVQYPGKFNDASLGQITANRMYSSGVDIIFHAAGATGLGVFKEAKERKTKNPDANVWVIGVDSDQYDEGKVNDNTNITLTSMLKRVDVAVQDVATQAQDGKFSGGETVIYGLKENGVDLADSRGNIPDDVLEEVEQYKQKIVDGEIEVPDTVK